MSPFNQTVVLVADDEPSTRTLVSNHLRTRGYEVLEAADGEEAWSLAQRHLPDLVVLDVMMPGMSGWEVCRRLRETVALAHTGVVMLTGIGESLNEMTSPLYGADAYLDKPFEFRDLDERLETTLARRRGGAFGRPDGADVDDGSVEDLSDLEPSEPAPLAAERRTVRSRGLDEGAEEPAPESAARPAAVRRQRAPGEAVKGADAPREPTAKMTAPAATPKAKRAAKEPAEATAPKAPKKAAKKAAPKAPKKAAPKAPKKAVPRTAKKAVPRTAKKAAPKAPKKAAPKAAKKAVPRTAKKAVAKAPKKAVAKAPKKAAPKAPKKAVPRTAKKAAPKAPKKAAPKPAKRQAARRSC